MIDNFRNALDGEMLNVFAFSVAEGYIVVRASKRVMDRLRESIPQHPDPVSDKYEVYDPDTGLLFTFHESFNEIKIQSTETKALSEIARTFMKRTNTTIHDSNARIEEKGNLIKEIYDDLQTLSSMIG